MFTVAEIIWISTGSPLEKAQNAKMKELADTCNKTILDRFSSKVDGVDYLFSNDMEAQANFEKCDRAFEKGRITEIPWTAYTMDGDVIRILLNEEKFEPVYISHLSHITGNISKFRDFLMPLVEDAKTVEEVEKVNWNLTAEELEPTEI